MTPNEILRHHVSGAVSRGQKEAIQAINGWHFTSCGYLNIRTGRAQSAWKLEGTAHNTARVNIAEIDAKIARLQLQRLELEWFLDGLTECSPKAL